MNPDRILAAVSEHTGVSVEEIRGPSRVAEITYARQLAVYFLRGAGLTYAGIGTILRRDHSTAYAACRRIQQDLYLAGQFSGLVQTGRTTQDVQAIEEALSGDH